MKKFKDETVEVYLESNGTICPYCGDTATMETDVVEPWNENEWAFMASCYTCKSQWRVIYRAKEILPISEVK